MMMNHISILIRAEGASLKLLIFSYVSCALFILSPSLAVMAQAPATATVAFMSKRDGNAEIYVMNPDGGEQFNVTKHHAEDYEPAWSPDGKQILFSSDRGGRFDLYLMDADGSNVRKVFKSQERRRSPAWSPDGKQIAYSQGEPGEEAIYLAALTGDAVKKLTDGFNPAWSPDGREIAFVVGGIKHAPLGIFDLQTRSQKTLLVKEMPWILSPAWSPRGDKLAFAEIDGKFDDRGVLLAKKSVLYIANRDGTGLQRVTAAEEIFPSSPAWSPEGNELLYSARLNKPGLPAQLFKTDMQGGVPTQLTHDGSNSWPDWLNPTARDVSPSVHSLTTTWGNIKED